MPSQREFELRREENGKALLLGVGRSYYCPTACITDPDHFRWADEIRAQHWCADFAEWMQLEGIAEWS